MHRSLRVVGGGLALAVWALASSVALAQAYPAKPIRLIFPFPPGGPTDLLGRAIAQKLADQMGQQVVADTRPGAGGNLGLELAAKSPPDGYTIVLSSPLVAISPSLYAKLKAYPVETGLAIAAGFSQIFYELINSKFWSYLIAPTTLAVRGVLYLFGIHTESTPPQIIHPLFSVRIGPPCS